jgi:outer membrane protein TolC
MNDSASLHELSAAAMLKRPEVTALGKQAQALTAQAASVKASYLPQIGFSAGYAKLDNRYLTQDKGWYAGVMMKWDLFDGGQTKLQSSKLLAESRAVDETLKDSQEKISLQVRQAWLNRRESSLRQELADKALAQAEQVSDLARERYRNGLANNTEVLDAETRRLQAYANRDQAKYDLILSDIQLQYASGLLGQH